MAEQKRYLDLDGLTTFWGKVKDQLNTKVDKVEGEHLMTAAERTKLAGIASGAEVNQNAFAKVKVGSTTITADAKQDTLTLEAGSGVSITADANNDKVTIAMSGAGSMTGGTVTDSTISGGTLSGTITNSGTISGGTISGSTISGGTLSGTVTAAANSTIDLDGAGSVLVPTATKGDNSTKAASTAFVKTAVDTAVSTINGTTNGLNTRLTAAEGAITTLNGTGTGSVKKTVADAIAGVVASAPADFDTLKEVADWIANDTSGAAKMQSDIADLLAVKGQVTSVEKHYTPAEDTNAALNASASSATNATGSSAAVNVVTGLKRDAKGHIVGVTSAKIYSTDTNTKVTSAANHYSPAAVDASQLNAGGATAEDITNGSGVQVVVGLKRDDKGHVVGVISKSLKSTNTNTTYTASTGLSLSSNAFSLKTAGVSGASGAQMGGIKVAKDNSSYSVTTLTSSISADVKSGKYYGVEIDKDDKAFVYIPWTDTNTKVTAVGNHYTPSGGTTTSASGGTLTDITNSSSGVQVLTGVTIDAAGHITGVTSKALKSVNSNTTYSASTGLSLSSTTFSLKTAGVNGASGAQIGGIKVAKDTTNYTVATKTSGTISANITDGQYYGVEIDKDDKAFVYVPWTDTKYTHPSHTAKSSGIYKITVNSLGHVSAATAVTETDLTTIMSGTITRISNVETICSATPTSRITDEEIDAICV